MVDLNAISDMIGQVTQEPVEHVNHPAHYGGSDNPYEAIKVIEAWNLDFCLGNTVKYISRAGKKSNVAEPIFDFDSDAQRLREEALKAAEIQDLRKARWYLDRRIEQLAKESANQG